MLEHLRSFRKALACCESQNPDDMNPPPPTRPIPLTKMAQGSAPSSFPPPIAPEFLNAPSIARQHAGESPRFPDQLEILRYRHHYGTNLGGYFVLEKWLHGSMFTPEAEGGSELDAVSAHFTKYGLEPTRAKWEAHWQSALSDKELNFLVHAGCNSVRLPIGHFIVGPGFCKDTPFDGGISSVYHNAWTAVKALCTRLHDAGIGTLVDLHALPYGANRDDHSGTSTGRAEFWSRAEHLDIATKCLEFIAHEIQHGHVPGCIGIQLCNEAASDAVGTFDWYQSMLIKLSVIDATIPIYISDGWNFKTALEQAAPFSRQIGQRNPVVIDTHKYYTFSADDKKQSPQQIIAKVATEAADMKSQLSKACEVSAVEFVIGEWSCVLDHESWRLDPDCSRDDTVRQFGQAQCASWHSCAAGSFFWTMKMDWMDGGEWGFAEMSKKGAIHAPGYMHWPFDLVRKKNASAQEQRNHLRGHDLRAHVAYWVNAMNGAVPELERYEDGWDLGFSDASSFFMARAKGSVVGATFGADRIGLFSLWVARRMRECFQEGEFAWRWQHGFREGVQAFEHFVGIFSNGGRGMGGGT